jgi:CheY-like chemotaxis protein
MFNCFHRKRIGSIPGGGVMEGELDQLVLHTRPTRSRPLLGLTVLVVEDSLYSSEALRLMCLRSGARIRRADCVASAQRHLNVYRRSVAIIDLGLPDGSGLDLIRTMQEAKARVPILLGTSGAEPEASATACANVGADGFLAKPMTSLAVFQSAILEHLPDALRPRGPRDANLEGVTPDPVALREDLTHALDLLSNDSPPLGYLRRFLIGLARSAEDKTLECSAQAMDGGARARDTAVLRGLLTDRIRALPMPI